MTVKTDTLIVRLRDTYLLNQLHDIRKKVVKQVNMAVLYELLNDVVLVLPGDVNEANFYSQISQHLTSNFYVELTLIKTPLPCHQKDSEGEKKFLETMQI
jgi:hypothetical protein